MGLYVRTTANYSQYCVSVANYRRQTHVMAVQPVYTRHKSSVILPTKAPCGHSCKGVMLLLRNCALLSLSNEDEQNSEF